MLDGEVLEVYERLPRCRHGTRHVRLGIPFTFLLFVNLNYKAEGPGTGKSMKK